MSDQWTSVDDYMPPEAHEVLVCCRQGTHVWMTVAHWTQKKWYGHDAVDVTHWMVLPSYP
jgi:hypothetical protein